MLRIGLLLLLLLGILTYAVSTQWRFRAVALKLRGELPTVSWSQVASSFVLGIHHDPREDLDLGLVQLGKGDGESPCPILWTSPLGDFWGDIDDRAGLELLVREQLIDRIYHNPTVGVEPGDIVLDVGGHLGTFTRFALDHGAGKVVVLEPDERNIECFRRTFADDLRQGTVELVEAAAWHEEGVLRFGGAGATARVSDGGAVEVRAVTIDGLVEELGLPSIDFIKMDIEGAEVDALRGARQTLARFGPEMALSTYHHPSHPREIPELVLAARSEYRVEQTREFAYFH